MMMSCGFLPDFAIMQITATTILTDGNSVLNQVVTLLHLPTVSSKSIENTPLHSNPIQPTNFTLLFFTKELLHASVVVSSLSALLLQNTRPSVEEPTSELTQLRLFLTELVSSRLYSNVIIIIKHRETLKKNRRITTNALCKAAQCALQSAYNPFCFVHHLLSTSTTLI